MTTTDGHGIKLKATPSLPTTQSLSALRQSDPLRFTFRAMFAFEELADALGETTSQLAMHAGPADAASLAMVRRNRELLANLGVATKPK